MCMPVTSKSHFLPVLVPITGSTPADMAQSLLILYILLFLVSLSSSSILLSCFTFQLIDLPVMFVNETADVCLVGLARLVLVYYYITFYRFYIDFSFLLFSILPPVLPSKGYKAPRFPGPVNDGGTRR